MRRWFGALLLLASCAWTPRQRERFFHELGRASAVAVIETVICSRIEKRFDIKDGHFEVPKRGCRRRQLPNGNVEFSFEGAGRFSTGFGFASGEFSQAAAVEYQVRILGGYIYVVPERVDVHRPQLFNLSLLASAAEALLGTVSGRVSAAIDHNMNTPRTIILSLQGRQCVVEGWLAPGTIPIRCGGADDGFFPRGGTEEPLTRVPSGWNKEGVNVTAALAPEPPAQSPEAVLAEAPTRDEPAVARPPLEQKGNELQSPSNAPGDEPQSSPRVDEEVRPPQPVPLRSLEWRRLEDERVRQFILENGDALAQGTARITHPGGKAAGLLSFELRGQEELIAVELEVAWSGRVVGSAYRTKVIWEFSRTEHLRLVVASDTSGAVVSPEAGAELEDFFRGEFVRMKGSL